MAKTWAEFQDGRAQRALTDGARTDSGAAPLFGEAWKESAMPAAMIAMHDLTLAHPNSTSQGAGNHGHEMAEVFIVAGVAEFLGEPRQREHVAALLRHLADTLESERLRNIPWGPKNKTFTARHRELFDRYLALREHHARPPLLSKLFA